MTTPPIPTWLHLKSYWILAASVGVLPLCVGIARAAQAQRPAPPQHQSLPPGSVGGRIVTTDSGQAVASARVILRSAEADLPDRRTTVTDVRGFYFFQQLAPGRYVIIASKPGFVDSAYGQRNYIQRGPVIHVPAGHTVRVIQKAKNRPTGPAGEGAKTDERAE